MQLKQLVTAIDAQVVAGDVIGAFDRFAADHCITHSNPEDLTQSKAQKLEALRWFFGNVAHINRIENPASVLVGDNESHSQFTFDFSNHQGGNMIYNEVIRRVWADGKLVEEQYLLGQTLAAPAKKATVSKKAEAAADSKPATAATEKKAAAPAKKAAVKTTAAPKKVVAPKADDLTLIEGVGPKIAELLIAGGIVTFADLAKAKPAAIKTILDAAGKRFQMHDPATWPKQAALARDGKSAELAILQDALKGGK